MFGVANQQRTAAVFEELFYLIRIQRRVEGNCGAAGREDPEVGGHPTRMIVGKNGDACAVSKLLFVKPAAGRFRHAAHLRIGVTFNPIASLDFEGNAVGPALGALAKAIVKSEHGADGELYLKLRKIVVTTDVLRPFQGLRDLPPAVASNYARLLKIAGLLCPPGISD